MSTMSVQRPPMCAMTITASAPRLRNSRAESIVAATGSPKLSDATFDAIVTFGVSGVDSPMMPSFTPATSTIVYGSAHDGVLPVSLSVMFAERNGYFASDAFLFSAPSGSSPGWRTTESTPTGP